MVHDPAAPTAALDRCVHDTRNAMAALTCAAKTLATADIHDPRVGQASAAVVRETHELVGQVRELIVFALHGAGTPAGALAVSDDARLLASMGGFLSGSGYQIRLAGSNEEGFRSLLQHLPQLTLIDVGTSRGHALSLARRARTAGFEGRMIAIWGSDRPALPAPRGGLTGFDAVLERSFDLPGLRAAVARD